jgi:hypothetical protein
MKVFMIAFLTCLSFSVAHADAKATPEQIENARKAAVSMVEAIALEKQGVLLAQNPGWSFSPFNPKDADHDKLIQVIPIQLFSRHANRIAVRMSLQAIGPNGEVKWFAGGNYRILVDLKDDGEVIAAELNYYNNLMSYDEPVKVTLSHE